MRGSRLESCPFMCSSSSCTGITAIARSVSTAPLGYLILAADGLHNLIGGGVAVGSAFIVDIRLGIVTWVVAAAHEIPPRAW